MQWFSPSIKLVFTILVSLLLDKTTELQKLLKKLCRLSNKIIPLGNGRFALNTELRIKTFLVLVFASVHIRFQYFLVLTNQFNSYAAFSIGQSIRFKTFYYWPIKLIHLLWSRTGKTKLKEVKIIFIKEKVNYKGIAWQFYFVLW